MQNGKKVIIAVIGILLAVSFSALAGIYIVDFMARSMRYPVVEDNHIISKTDFSPTRNRQSNYIVTGPGVVRLYEQPVPASAAPVRLGRDTVDAGGAKGVSLAIYRDHPDDSTAFHIGNMFPGDWETKSFFLQVSYRGTIAVRFHADILSGYQKLAEVLKCKVHLRTTGETLYDGLMRDMPESINHRLSSSKRTTDELVYDITAYLDTSVGNEYMGKELAANFRWWVEEGSSGSYTPVKPSEPDKPVEPDRPADPDKPDDPDEPDKPIEPDEPIDPEEPEEPEDPGQEEPGELVDPPRTGDTGNVFRWVAVMGASLFALILLWRRKREDEDEQKI